MPSISMFKLAIALAIGFLSFGTVASPSKRGTGILKTMADLQLDGAGVVHVAKDGVARSYAENGTVIDYVQLDSAALSVFVANLPPTMSAEQKEDIKDTFAGVNGFDVKSRIQLLDPPASLRPSLNALSEEQLTTANEAYLATHNLETASHLPACVGTPCKNTNFCKDTSECNKCMAPIGEHSVATWCHYL